MGGPFASTDHMHTLIPRTLRTERLFMRPWAATDAAALLPVLTANVEHLGPWIPAHVWTPVPPPELTARLAGFAEDFAADRSYRFALFDLDDTQVLGEVDLFPRAASGRVPLADADHVELGYWLDVTATGRGFASEACRALFDVARTLPGMTHVDIRCDAANVPSAAVPLRLGFHLAAVEREMQVWRKQLASDHTGA